MFSEVNIPYHHKELDFIDFNYQPLLYHKLSQFGPGISVEDINGDGLWNVLDVVLVINYIFDLNTLTNEQLINADLNQDGIINILDVVQMVNIILSI